MDTVETATEFTNADIGTSKTLYIAPEKAKISRVPNAKTFDADQLLDAILIVKNGESNACVLLPIGRIDQLRKCMNLIPVKCIALDGAESPIRASEWALTTDFLDHVSLLELEEVHKQVSQKKAIDGQKKVFDVPKRAFKMRVDQSKGDSDE